MMFKVSYHLKKTWTIASMDLNIHVLVQRRAMKGNENIKIDNTFSFQGESMTKRY